MFHRVAPAALCAIGILFAAGCGAATGKVSGTVTIKGAKIKRGLITFMPEAGAKDVYNAAIIDSKYETGEIPAGSAKIMITPGQDKPAPVAQQTEGVDTVAPPKASGPSTAALEVPEKYQNADTTPLKFTIKGGANQFDADLVP